MVICLERGADLHMAQLMPLPPLTISCFSKIQIGFTFLVGLYRLTRVYVCFSFGSWHDVPPAPPVAPPMRWPTSVTAYAAKLIS